MKVSVTFNSQLLSNRITKMPKFPIELNGNLHFSQICMVKILKTLHNWVFHDRPVWCISVRLFDRTKVTRNKINFVKNCPQWGLNSQPPDHESPALTTVLSHYLVVGVGVAFIKSCSIDSRNKQSPTCEVVHETKERSLQKSPTDSLLAQLVEQETDDQEVMSSNPTGGNFWKICFVLCNFRSVR